MKNKKYLIATVLSFLMTSIFADNLAVDQLSQKLTRIGSMQASFSQVVMQNKNRILQKSSGYMALQRPNKFRWDIRDPNKELIVADGKNIWVYNVALQQVTRSGLQHQKQSMPAALLSGLVKTLQQQFNVKIIKQNGENILFQLNPKSSDTSFRSVYLQFSGNKIVSMQFVDSLGQLSRIEFSRVMINLPLPLGLFSFNPPKGVDVVDN